jgi:hypothetical protein
MGKTKATKSSSNIYDTGTLHYDLWNDARERVIGVDRQRMQIGTLSEKTVHAVVKNYYEPDEDHQEIPIEGKCADIYTADERIIEIQTRNFSRLKEKLDIFLPLYDVTVVLPVPDRRRIIWIDPDTGEESGVGAYRSALAPWPAFREIYMIREYLSHPHMHVRLLLMNMTEYRLLSGRSKDRKKYGAERYDRIPEELTGEIVLNEPKDYMLFLPDGLIEETDSTFTSAMLAYEAHIPKQYLSYVTGLLRLLGVIERLPKRQDKTWLYRVNY